MRKCAFGRFAVWTLAVAAGLIGAGFFLGYGSHIKTAVSKAREAMKRQVPPEFEIARIRNELQSIDKDIDANFDAYTHEVVLVNRLKEEIAGMKTNLEKQKRVVLTLKRDVESGNRTVKYGPEEYTPDELKVVLAREFDAYKSAEGAVKAKDEELKARLQGLKAGRDKIEAMKNAKETLGAELAKIEAEYKRVQVVETKSPFQVDGSRLANIKSSIQDLKDRVKEMELKQVLRGQFKDHESILERVEDKAKGEQVLKEIDKHFGTTPDKLAEK